MLVATGDTLSSVFGWASIACWLVVYTPQLYENYTLQSGEGVSVAFVIVWLVGDIFNLAGAVIAGLLPTIIIIAAYYSVSDIILLFQIYYYRRKRAQLSQRALGPASRDERSPLISSQNENQSVASESTPIRWVLLKYSLLTLVLAAVCTGGWWLHENAQGLTDSEPTTRNSWLVQFFGWGSAILFLGARIPQILKNIKTRCEGLSPALFFFSILGNTTYALSICAKSMDKAYLLTNAGWLAGSALTVFLDLFVLCQFVYYRTQEEERRRAAS
ncbi:PQ loop repeat-domain-containing protein [Coprinopsis sp. MPI-PUGE-AT-0042]|nr:PQ loop repeat-domain-containing protein [Coprinopsis sp. MPI-PUGE-AT-0042]